MKAVSDATDRVGEPKSPDDEQPAADPFVTTVSTRSVAGVTLVQVELRNTVSVDLRVRVRNELDGPVLPPREEGLPASGWGADGFCGAVPASGRRGVGYACPVSSPTETDTHSEAVSGDSELSRDSDAVSIDVLGPADGSESQSTPTAAAIRSLGRARPPADVVENDVQNDADTDIDTGADHLAAASAVETPDGSTVESTPESTGQAEMDKIAAVGEETDSSPENAVGARSGTVPVAVDVWLDAAERRIGHAERLTGGTAEEATAVLVDRGGADALAGLPEAVAADESSLRAAASRMRDLAERAAATDAAPVVSSLSEAAVSSNNSAMDSHAGSER
ncbi:DUF7857 domain-containing protein [Halobellus captivus]|uniref:DUF7857 domain-containing protein n=1 Tax=Halobellus captivus TaxID=2592614 RepID=UPI00119D6671|nr:hypothetical protein [Halobellus captivus]